jgi:hypothetical protein
MGQAMKQKLISCSLVSIGAVLISALAVSNVDAELVVNPKQAGTSIDIGQLIKDHKKQPITRTGVFLTTSGIYNEKLEIRATLGGLFWYPFPEQPTPARLVRFGPGVGEAQGIYSFGDAKNPSSQLEFGLFNNKYNDDARNLGEYLYRSGTYPGHIWTGGWSYMNSASYMAQGAKFSLPTYEGKVNHDFTLFMERDAIAPIHDFSLGYVIAVKPVSFLDFGGGVVWSNALSLNPDRLAPRVKDNAYSTITNLPVKGATDSATLDSTHWDYYTFRGFKVMAKAGLDLGSLLGSDKFQSGDFKIYSEVALLGVKDQPYYYSRKSERMPIMAGINLPTFGLLTKLTFETEYYKSRYPNTIYYPFDSQLGLPLPLGGDGGESDPKNFSDSAFAADKKKFTQDDWKWSIYASRRIMDGVSLHVQAASDHLRHFNPEAKPSNKPSTLTPSDWYYVVRLDFGLF